MEFEKAKWRIDLEASLGTRTVFILYGNVHDLQMDSIGESCFTTTLDDYLHTFLSDMGYTHILFYNRVEGFYNRVLGCGCREVSEIVASASPHENTPKPNECTFEAASIIIERLLVQDAVDPGNKIDSPLAVVFDMATSAVEQPDRPDQEERAAFSRLLNASKRSQSFFASISGLQLSNILIVVCDKPNDLPSWFYVSNPYAKTLSVTKPSYRQRLSFFSQPEQLVAFPDSQSLNALDSKRFLSELCNLTEGFSCVELQGLISSCSRGGGTSIKNAKREIDRFRYGETRDYWSRLDKQAIQDAEKLIRSRIIGQEFAVDKAVDVLYRAASNLSTSSSASSSTKPKGVLFLAGPTGTGKTELAKAITEAVFSDEAQMIRFDMSEFGERHSDQRLFGAPPGYIGFDEGGELTNAVRERPFSLLLFDEIEKAHSSILDKFLQIIDDGRLTDSHGETVYFGETLIVFTSNLGMTKTDPQTGEIISFIEPETYPNKTQFHKEVRNRLKKSLRPEFKNRIESGIVIFDFIDETSAKAIAKSKMISFGKRMLSDHEITILVSKDFYYTFETELISNRAMGGRGIVNKLQELLLDPLSRTFVEEGVSDGDTLLINGFDHPVSRAGTLLNVIVNPAACSDVVDLLDLGEED